MAAFLATYLGASLLTFAVGILLLGLVCAVLHLNRAAYRFAGITLAIVAMGARDAGTCAIAMHRFLEVSLGIAVGLVMTAVWPEQRRGIAAAGSGDQ